MTVRGIQFGPKTLSKEGKERTEEKKEGGEEGKKERRNEEKKEDRNERLHEEPARVWRKSLSQ